jgi:hypothetical protein
MMDECLEEVTGIGTRNLPWDRSRIILSEVREIEACR